jgi:uncharacterized protein
MSVTVAARRESKLAERVAKLDWQRIVTDLDRYGCAVAKQVLKAEECRELSSRYDREEQFRSRIIMARHGFGRGEYKYWAYPLPEIVQTLRSTLYPHLGELANRWNETMNIEVRYPATHAEYLEQCHHARQSRPTPLLLKYQEGDFNCLHQDVYGGLVFPLQAAFLLSMPGQDFTGGEFVLTEQRPRMQSRAEVVQLEQGDGVIFAVHHRPVQGAHGAYRVNLRHGVSRIRSGQRYTMGIIFHDGE